MRLYLEYFVGENTLVIYLNLKVDQNNQDMNSKGTTFLFFMINMCLFVYFFHRNVQ